MVIHCKGTKIIRVYQTFSKENCAFLHCGVFYNDLAGESVTLRYLVKDVYDVRAAREELTFRLSVVRVEHDMYDRLPVLLAELRLHVRYVPRHPKGAVGELLLLDNVAVEELVIGVGGDVQEGETSVIFPLYKPAFFHVLFF